MLGIEHYCAILIQDHDPKIHRALYWRKVVTDDTILGSTSKRTAPAVVQLFIECSLDDSGEESSQRERELYKLKKAIENTFRSAGIAEEHAYLVSLSNRTVVYKGQLTPEQVPRGWCPDSLSHARMILCEPIHSN